MLKTRCCLLVSSSRARRRNGLSIAKTEPLLLGLYVDIYTCDVDAFEALPQVRFQIMSVGRRHSFAPLHEVLSVDSKTSFLLLTF